MQNTATASVATQLKGRSLVSIPVLQPPGNRASPGHRPHLGDGRNRNLEGSQVALLFYEASTRTRNSFLTAIHHLGGAECGFSSGEGSSVSKGESLADTIRMFSSYCEAIVLRHPGTVRPAGPPTSARFPSSTPATAENQHPTQTLLDLYAVQNTQGRLQNLSVGMMGDLKFGRTVHSLADALSLYPGNQLHLISPPSLVMPEPYIASWRDRGLEIHVHNRLEDVVPAVDILYCTRIQRERLPDDSENRRKSPGPLPPHRQPPQKSRRDLPYPPPTAGRRNPRRCRRNALRLLLPASRRGSPG